jgi:hypothetical protein
MSPISLSLERKAICTSAALTRTHHISFNVPSLYMCLCNSVYVPVFRYLSLFLALSPFNFQLIHMKHAFPCVWQGRLCQAEYQTYFVISGWYYQISLFCNLVSYPVHTTHTFEKRLFSIFWAMVSFRDSGRTFSSTFLCYQQNQIGKILNFPLCTFRIEWSTGQGNKELEIYHWLTGLKKLSFPIFLSKILCRGVKAMPLETNLLMLVFNKVLESLPLTYHIHSGDIQSARTCTKVTHIWHDK